MSINYRNFCMDNTLKTKNIVYKLFTLIELLVVIGIIAILMTMLLPALKSARDMAKQLSCANNLKTMGTCVQFYTNDNNGFYPRVGGYGVLLPSGQWVGDIAPYLEGQWNWGWSTDSAKSAEQIFICTSDQKELYCGVNYKYNFGFGFYSSTGNRYPDIARFAPKKGSMLDSPSEIVLIGDGKCNSDRDGWRWESGTDSGMGWYRHAKKMNANWADGHVQIIRYGELSAPESTDLSMRFN